MSPALVINSEYHWAKSLARETVKPRPCKYDESKLNRRIAFGVNVAFVGVAFVSVAFSAGAAFCIGLPLRFVLLRLGALCADSQFLGLVLSHYVGTVFENYER
jgi:hypothetical protein